MRNSQSIVRAVVLNYRHAALTARCVRSLLSQKGVHLEVVVVDNSADDAETGALRSALPGSVVLLVNASNTGYSAGNNAGLRACEKLRRPEFSLIVNSDAVFQSQDTVANLVCALESDERAVAISPLVWDLGISDPRSSVQVRRCPTYKDLLVAYSCWLSRVGPLKDIWGKHTYEDMRPYEPGRVYDSDSINGCCFLIKQDFLQRINYLDEGTFLYMEEMILALQIGARGFRCLLHAGECVRHRQGASSGQGHKKVLWRVYREGIKSQLYVCEKYLGCSQWQLMMLKGVRTVDFVMRKVQMFIFGLLAFFNVGPMRPEPACSGSASEP